MSIVPIEKRNVWMREGDVYKEGISIIYNNRTSCPQLLPAYFCSVLPSNAPSLKSALRASTTQPLSQHASPALQDVPSAAISHYAPLVLLVLSH